MHFKNRFSSFFKICLLFFCLLTIITNAQNVIIKGKAPGAEEKIISLLTYNNQLTYTEKKLTSSPVDSVGNFLISLNLDDTIYAILKIDYYKSYIYIEPGKTYEIKIDSIDYNAPDKINPYYEPKQLNYILLNFNKNDLNFIIRSYDEIYNDYLYKNGIAIYRLRDFSKIDTFRLIIKKLFSFNKCGYFWNYVDYSIGLMEIPFLSITTRGLIAEKYLKEHPVIYENIKYMDFFNQFFENYLLNSYAIKKQDLIQTINYTPDYYALTDTLGKDSILRNEVLREMVLLKGLYELSFNKEFNKNNIAAILLQLSKHSKFEQHRKIAEDIMQLFNKLQPETYAPTFSLKDIDKKVVSLSDYKGKYLYLSFWTSWCTACQSEFDVMMKLKEIYGAKIAFVSICADKEFLTMLNYLKTQKYNWQFLHFSGDYDLLDAYDVRSYPIFAFIDPQGKIICYPAPKPSENIAAYFEYYSKKDSKNIKKPLFPRP